MQTLVALLVVTAAACAIARPPGSRIPGAPAQRPQEDASPQLPQPLYPGQYYMPPLLNYQGYEENPRTLASENSNHDWLNKEIDRINQMEVAEDALSPYEADLSQWIPQDPYIRRIYQVPVMKNQIAEFSPEISASNTGNLKMLDPITYTGVEKAEPISIKGIKQIKNSVNQPNNDVSEDHKKEFALTPRDKEYYEYAGVATSEEIHTPTNNPPRASNLRVIPIFEPPRQIRQNPNLSRSKTLVADNLDRLRAGLSQEDQESTVRTHVFHVSEPAPTDTGSVYSVGFIAMVLAAITMSAIALLVGWYTLSRKAKAAADVDYPAYGVTGPTVDSSGDRKLAHSAHMYHYQHQKQQIIAMERNGMEPRNGSVSDPESEEENEEGDYTVYECPGFATTGDMEVKNPLYSEEPTPASPGKCEVVEPKPKE